MKTILNAGLVAAMLVLTSPAGQAQNTGSEARVSLRVEGRQLQEVVRTLRESSGANIVVIGDVAEDTVDIELTDVHWRQALELVAEDKKCVVEERVGGVLVVKAQTPVSFEFEDSEISEVIELIAKSGDASIVWSPDVKGTISMHLKDIPWRYALDVAVKTLGFTVVEEERGILRIVDPLSLQTQMETRSYQLRYLRPEGVYVPAIKSEFVEDVIRRPPGDSVADDFTVLQALQKALTGGGEMDYIESQNVIIVRDTKQVHARIQDILSRLDVEPAQVFVDVKFVSTFNSDILNLGVDYGDNGPSVAMSGGAIPITLPFGLGDGDWEDFFIAHPSGSGPFADPILNPGATLIPPTVFGSLSFTDVNASLRLLQRDTQSEVIQAPKLIALDGEEATIFVGETVRYAEAMTEQGQAGGNALSLVEAEGSPVDIGFQLLVVPHVIPGSNSLTMEIIPKETSLSGTGSSPLAPAGFDVFTIGASGLEGVIALPRTRSSTIVTNMLLESGQTAVIGGLTTDSDVTTESRVPGLWRIPVLGNLFKHETQDHQRRSLIVFVTPTIMHSSADTERLLQRELRRRDISLKDELETMFGEADVDSSSALEIEEGAEEAPFDGSTDGGGGFLEIEEAPEEMQDENSSEVPDDAMPGDDGAEMDILDALEAEGSGIEDPELDLENDDQ